MMIRKIQIVILFLLLFKAGYSQTKKGTVVLSGKTNVNFLFSNTTTGKDSISSSKIKTNQFGFDAGFGYFVADNFVIALSGAYSYSYIKVEPGVYDPTGSENITTTLGVIPQLTYYFPLEGKLKPSVSIGAGYVWLRERDSKVSGNNNIVYSLTGPSFNGGGGLSYFITKFVAFELGLQYTHNSLKNNAGLGETQKQNAVAGTFGVSVFL